MLSIEYTEFAPSYLKSLIAENHLESAKAYAAFTMSNGPFPSLRDRTEEMTKAVKGMADSNEVTIIDRTGLELAKDYNAMCRQETFHETVRFVFA